MEKMRISDYKRIAKESLKGQWGVNAGFIFLSSLLGMAIGQVTGIFNSGAMQTILTFLISTFVLFAFSYAIYYVGLFVVRGGRTDIGQLLRYFKGNTIYHFLLSISFILSCNTFWDSLFLSH